VIFLGASICDGWSVATDGDAASWVPNDKLVEELPTLAPGATPAPRRSEIPPSTQAALDVLDLIYTDVYGLASEISGVVDRVLDDSISYAEAAEAMYLLEDTGYQYSDLLLSDDADLTEAGPECDAARRWYGEAIYQFGLSAGYYGLAFELWPDYSLDDAIEASNRGYDALETAIESHSFCGS